MSRVPREIVISESFVDLTGDFIKAVILKSLVDETATRDDFKDFLVEESKRFQQERKTLIYGWISKPAHDLSEQTLLRLTPPPIRSHLNHLVENGFLFKKKAENPFDKTMYYRINLIKITTEMLRLGYRFSEYDALIDIPLPFLGKPEGRNALFREAKSLDRKDAGDKQEKKKMPQQKEHDTNELQKIQDASHTPLKEECEGQLRLWD